MKSFAVLHTLLALSILGAPGISTAADIPSPVVNIVRWDSKDLPPVYERSEQLPLTREDLLTLSRNEFSPETLARMVRQRHYTGDASATALVELKQLGVPPAVIEAVSLHALPPNRFIQLTVQLEFDGTSAESRQRYLYVILPDGNQERIFTADLGTVLAGRWHNDTRVDQTDLLLPRQIRQVSFSDTIPLKSHGAKTLLVVTSTRPDIQSISDIPEADRKNAREYTLNYPVSSLQQDCRLRVRYHQDAVLPHKWEMVSTHLDCEWN
ncbi:MAG: hypothetical protein O2954_18295 [bacterium]|nr:hypothetical protein [bacterium]